MAQLQRWQQRGKSDLGALSTALEWDIRAGKGGHRHEEQSGHRLQTMENSFGKGKRETGLRNTDLRLRIRGRKKTMTFCQDTKGLQMIVSPF